MQSQENMNDFTRRYPIVKQRTLSEHLNDAREFRKACLQRLEREETNVCRCVELDVLSYGG